MGKRHEETKFHQEYCGHVIAYSDIYTDSLLVTGNTPECYSERDCIDILAQYVVDSFLPDGYDVGKAETLGEKLAEEIKRSGLWWKRYVRYGIGYNEDSLQSYHSWWFCSPETTEGHIPVRGSQPVIVIENNWREFLESMVKNGNS